MCRYEARECTFIQRGGDKSRTVAFVMSTLQGREICFLIHRISRLYLANPPSLVHRTALISHPIVGKKVSVIVRV